MRGGLQGGTATYSVASSQIQKVVLSDLAPQLGGLP